MSISGVELPRLRAVDHLDGFGEAWFNGRFGAPQATVLSRTHGNPRVRDHLPDFAPTLLDYAEQLPHSDFTETVDHFVRLADEDGAHDDRDGNVAGRSAAVLAVGSALHVSASGSDPLTAAEMIAIHDRYCDIEYQRDLDARRAAHGDEAELHELPRTHRQRRFDALIAIFRSAAHGDGIGSVADPLVNIEIDAHTFGRILLDAELSTSTDLDGNPIDPFTGLAQPSDLRDGPDLLDGPDPLDNPTQLVRRRCETTNGVQLNPHDVLRAALGGHVRRAVLDSDGVTIDLGRRQRLFTGSARDAAELMVRHCEHPGCELPAEWCEVDHAVEWAEDDGPTDQQNARIRCGSHNREKHRKRWRTRRATNGRSYTIRADGTIMLPAGARDPTFTDPGTDPGNDTDGDRSSRSDAGLDEDLDDPAEVAG